MFWLARVFDEENNEYLNEFILNNDNMFLLDKNIPMEAFFKDKNIKKVLPYTYLKLSKSENIINSSEIINSDDIKKKFLAGCINTISKDKLKNNSRALQYGCITQNGKLVCGNRYK